MWGIYTMTFHGAQSLVGKLATGPGASTWGVCDYVQMCLLWPEAQNVFVGISCHFVCPIADGVLWAPQDFFFFSLHL